MATLLFKLRFVPEDEAQDVRELLAENEIDFYETTAGILGISMPALWLRDDSQLDKARKLINDYQQRRQNQVRDEYNRQKLEGTSRSMIDIFREDPLRFLGYSLIIFMLVYFSVVLFFSLGT
jgi:hypothetical protein